MRLFIDCEWNGYGGELISMALVPLNSARHHLYFEVDLPEGIKIDPWVEENVLTKLDGPVHSYEECQAQLSKYLLGCQGPVEIIADWPEDIERLCRMLITGAGTKVAAPRKLIMTIMDFDEMDTISRVPHHALHDARAIRGAYVERFFNDDR